MSTTIPAGHTDRLHGSLASGQILVAQYGGYGFYNGYSGPGSSTHGAVLKVDLAFTNDGTVVLQGMLSEQTYLPHASATLQNSGLLTNNGTIDVNGSAAYFGPETGPGALLLNQGVLLNHGEINLGGGSGGFDYSYGTDVPGRLVDNGVMDNTGQVVVSATFAGYYNDHGHSPGELDVNGVFLNGGNLVIESGNLSYGGIGATVNVSGVLTNRADGVIGNGNFGQAGWLLDVAASGTLNNAGMLAMSYSNQTGATLAVAGLLRNSGTLELQSGGGYNGDRPGGGLLELTGTMLNTGFVAIDDQTHPLTYNFGGGGGTLNDSGVLTNAGSIAVYGGGFNDYRGFDVQAAPGLLTDSGVLTNTSNGTITLMAAAAGYVGAGSATLSVTGTLTDSGTIAGGGVLINAGLVDNGADGGVISAAMLVNDGSIATAAHSSFLIGSDISALAGDHGVIDIAAGSTLSLTGMVAASQTAMFAGNNATLAIGDAQGFAGVLDLDQRSLTLDFLAQNVTSASSGGTTLAIGFGNGTTLDYTLAAPLAAGTTIGLHADGTGGTDVSFSGPGGRAVPSSLPGAYGGQMPAGRDATSVAGLMHLTHPG